MVRCAVRTPQLDLRRVRSATVVQLPVAPSAAGEAVLEEHANNCHHSQPTIRKLGVELRLASFLVLHGAAGVRDAQNASVGIVARLARLVVLEVASVESAAEDEYLGPAGSRHL